MLYRCVCCCKTKAQRFNLKAKKVKISRKSENFKQNPAKSNFIDFERISGKIQVFSGVGQISGVSGVSGVGPSG